MWDMPLLIWLSMCQWVFVLELIACVAETCLDHLLMNQTQKLFGKWLTCQAAPRLDKNLSQSQLGFRRQRQASEAIHTLQHLTLLSQEWQQPLTILRLGIREAFDRMHQSAILEMLSQSDLPPPLSFNLARELLAPTPEPQNRQIRQKNCLIWFFSDVFLSDLAFS